MRSLLLALTLTTPLHAVSFDCTKATTLIEKRVCASPKLGAADDRLNAAYKSLLAAFPPAYTPEIRDQQRTWLRQIVFECIQPSNDIDSCLQRQYAAQTSLLSGRIFQLDGLTFFVRSITLNAPAHKPSDDESFAETWTKTLGPGTITAFWPQALSEEPAWLAWNTAIESATRAFTAPSNGRSPVSQWQRSWAGYQDSTVTTTLQLISANLVTAKIYGEFYSYGAAHPNDSSQQFNWLPTQHRELTPADLFLTDSNWKQLLTRICTTSIQRQLTADGDSIFPNEFLLKTIRETALAPRNWQLDAKGITVVFQRGSVTCRACTLTNPTIPWSRLKPVLQPTFPLPQPAH